MKIFQLIAATVLTQSVALHADTLRTFEASNEKLGSGELYLAQDSDSTFLDVLDQVSGEVNEPTEPPEPTEPLTQKEIQEYDVARGKITETEADIKGYEEMKERNKDDPERAQGIQKLIDQKKQEVVELKQAQEGMKKAPGK